VRGFFATVTDVSRIVRAEMALRESEACEGEGGTTLEILLPLRARSEA